MTANRRDKCEKTDQIASEARKNREENRASYISYQGTAGRTEELHHRVSQTWSRKVESRRERCNTDQSRRWRVESKRKIAWSQKVRGNIESKRYKRKRATRLTLTYIELKRRKRMNRSNRKRSQEESKRQRKPTDINRPRIEKEMKWNGPKTEQRSANRGGETLQNSRAYLAMNRKNKRVLCYEILREHLRIYLKYKIE